MNSKVMAPEVCVSYGGHCWQRRGYVMASNPPQYPEICTHCRSTRRAIPNEPFSYINDAPHGDSPDPDSAK